MNLLAYVHLHRLERPTGVGRVIEQLVRHLAASDAVDILAQRDDIARVVPKLAPAWHGFRYHAFDRSVSRQQLQWLLPGCRRAERWWPEADIVFAPSESYVPTRSARSAVTIHDTAYFEDGAHSSADSITLQRLKWTVLHRVIARRVDLIHTVSHFSAERLAHFFPAMAPRIRVAHNGIDDFFFAVGDKDAAILQRYNPDRRRFVLVPGGLSFRKNAELILKAWPLLQRAQPDLQLFVTSNSDERYAEAARAMPSIKLLGFVEDESLRALYHAAEIVWFPSRYEGFGIPVIEAMAGGTPVVTSNASSLPEIGGDAALYAGIDDAAGHVEAIDGLLRDTALHASLSARGRIRALGFTGSASAATLRGHLATLL